LVVLSLLCAGCDGDDLDKIVEDIDNSQFAEDVNESYDNAVERVEDYVDEAVNDAVDMTTGLAEENLPTVSPETSKDLGNAVIENLDAVGQIVLDADTAAKELQACFETCDSLFPDEGTNKTAYNITCVAECKGQ